MAVFKAKQDGHTGLAIINPLKLDKLENAASVVVTLHLFGSMQSNTRTFVNSVATAATNLSDSLQVCMSCFFQQQSDSGRCNFNLM